MSSADLPRLAGLAGFILPNKAIGLNFGHEKLEIHASALPRFVCHVFERPKFGRRLDPFWSGQPN
jgi:hypothetical protein